MIDSLGVSLVNNTIAISMNDVIIILCACVFTVIFLDIKLLYVIGGIRQQLDDTILNNTRLELTKIIYKECEDLSNNTECERALLSYMYDKVDRLMRYYNELKLLGGTSNLNNGNFKRMVIGNGEMELSKKCNCFPKEFTSKLDNINTACYEEFVCNMTRKYENKHEFIKNLKYNTIASFKKNVRLHMKKYNDTRHLITDEEYVKVYPELTSTKDTNNFVDKNKLYTIISDRGNTGIIEVLDALMVITNDDFKYKELVALKARINTCIRDINFGTDDSNLEVNKIRTSLLELINTI